MLQKIIIKNLAIINNAEIAFSDSLNIITGETGSGKSLIVNAIDLLLGAKFSKENFRDENEIELIGYFAFDNEKIEIKRIFNCSGNHKTFINNKQSTNYELKNITKNYIDMHSQYNQHSIFDKSIHIDYLDIFGNYSDLLDKLSQTFIDYEANRKKLLELKKEKNDIASKRELYDYQLSELNDIDLYEGVDYDISRDYDKMSNIESIKKTIKDVIGMLDGDESSLKKDIAKSIKLLSSLSDIDDEFDNFTKIFENIKIDIDELKYDMNLKKDEYVFDSEKFNALSDKLEKVQMIKRKYGGTIQSAISYKDKIEKYLDNVLDVDAKIDNFERR